jgi:hypothetical protein
MKRPPLVEVEWTDHCGWSQWAPREEHAKGMGLACTTAGYLLSKTPKHLVIALNLSETRADSSITLIRSCVKRIRRLKR